MGFFKKLFKKKKNKHKEIARLQEQKAERDAKFAAQNIAVSDKVRNNHIKQSERIRDRINEMMEPDFPEVFDDVSPVGPAWGAGGFEKVIVKDDNGHEFKLLFLPDRNNNQLKDAKRPMQFYYAQQKPRLAVNEEGHYEFHLQKFSGIMDPTKNIGAEGYAEVAGGFMTFATTLALPEGILEKAKEELRKTIINQYGDGDQMAARLWRGKKNDLLEYFEPNLQPITPIESTTSVHVIGQTTDNPNDVTTEGGHNIKAWMCKYQGGGTGPLDPNGTQAFSAMLGQYPVQLIEAAMMKGVTSNVVVETEFKFKTWSTATEIRITGNWESIYNHFSTALSGKYMFASADIELAFDTMRKLGTIRVDVKYDSEFVTPEHQSQYDAIASEAVKAFTQQATNVIFEEVPKEEAAKAETSGFGKIWGVALKLKFTRDKREVKLDYIHKVAVNSIRTTKLSAPLDSFTNEVAQDAELLKRYFSNVYLEEGFKKIHVFATANANWEQIDGRPGDPINRLSVQVGYPDSKGNINWKSAARYKQEDGTLTDQPDMASWTLDNKNRVYVFDFTKHENLGDDQNKIYIRKDISFKEDPRVPVNTITEEYTVDGDETIEVRAETAGKVSVGPIDVDTPIETDQVKAMVTFRVPNLEPQVFELNTESMKKAQYFEVWYAKPEDVQSWEYNVEAIVKGKRFGQKSVRWASGWIKGTGNGPITVDIPDPTNEQNRLIEEYLTETAPAAVPA